MNVLSLRAWLSLAAHPRIGVDAVGATLVGWPHRRDLLEAIWERDISDELARVLERARTLDAEGHIFRWDPAAPEGVKRWANAGRGSAAPGAQARRLSLDDPRFFDVLCEFPEPRVCLWRRPWVKADVVEDYPVEFRVFARHGDVRGVSSYYPQRPLPDSYQQDARAAALRARRFLPFVSDFTLDFLRTAEGGLVMLEGGPPHDEQPGRGGAHPCCFAPGAVDGIALSPREGALGR